ncbi:ATP-dependent DNA ligase [Streptomyces sp. NPDC051546]|uniref:ATP-dependent DNA ligase n=1 Tax=Streptomyces sp. NPDC051546 TaxID=3365655 RepID=UPI003795E461
MLAQAAEYTPGSGVLAGGTVAAEQKLDGYRTILFTPIGPGGQMLLQTRRGSLIQDAFPDLVAAAAQLPDGLVLDGEVVTWDTAAGQLSFEALQRRAAARGRTAAALATKTPAFFIAFDALQISGTSLLTLSYAERRRRLEVLFAAHQLASPWTLCPQTTDPATAREWMEEWTDVPGVEGLVLKNLNQRYLPGVRGWTKIRRRDTSEAVIGAITGTLKRPELLLLGRHDETGRLRPVGRTVPLRPGAARELSAHLTAAGPGHPWTGARFSSAWGSRDVLDTILVEPDLVAEISADTSTDRGGVWRHPIRYYACAWTRPLPTCPPSVAARHSHRAITYVLGPGGDEAVGHPPYGVHGGVRCGYRDGGGVRAVGARPPSRPSWPGPYPVLRRYSGVAGVRGAVREVAIALHGACTRSHAAGCRWRERRRGWVHVREADRLPARRAGFSRHLNVSHLSVSRGFAVAVLRPAVVGSSSRARGRR